MGLPRFVVEYPAYRSGERYRLTLSTRTFGGALLVPAVPDCDHCDNICDKCFDCIDGGGTFGGCRSCGACRYCIPRCGNGGIGSGEGSSCQLSCGVDRAGCYGASTEQAVCNNSTRAVFGNVRSLALSWVSCEHQGAYQKLGEGHG